MSVELQKRFKNALLCAILGDVKGTPFQSTVRLEEVLSLDDFNILTDRYCISKPWLKGLFSDDTSLTLATMHGLSKIGTIPKDNNDYSILAKEFIEWLINGKYTQNGRAWDVGKATKKNIKYLQFMITYQIFDIKKIPVDENSCGNGSLMRFLPIPFVLYKQYGVGALSLKSNIDFVYNVSSLTHQSSLCKASCLYYTQIMLCILDGIRKADLMSAVKEHLKDIISLDTEVFKDNFSLTEINDITSSGFVKSSLEAAMWCFLRTDTVEECIIKCIQLGGDTDTIACIAGGISGAYYNRLSSFAWLSGNIIDYEKCIEPIENEFIQTFL